MIYGLDVFTHNPDIDKNIGDRFLGNLLSIFVSDSSLIFKINFFEQRAYQESLRARVEHFR